MGIARLRRVSYEVESAFAVENGSHSWLDVRAVKPEFQRAQAIHEIEEVQARITQYAGRVLGRKSASRLTLGVSLRGDGTALSAAASPSDDYLQGLLGYCMGGTENGAGSTINGAGATTTVLPVAVGHGSRFFAGGAVMVGGEISAVESVTGDNVTLKHALSSAPADTTPVYNSYTAYIDPSAANTLQWRVLGDADTDVWLLLGVIGGFGFANLLQSDGTLPQVMFDLMVTNWEASGDSLAAGTYDGGAFLGTAEEMDIIFVDHGTTTRSTVACSALEMSPGITWTQLIARGSGEAQHVDRYTMTDVAPSAQLTIDPSTGYNTDFTSGDYKALMVCFGGTPGQSWALELPRALVQAPPGRAVHGEQHAHQITLRGCEDDCGAGTSALTRSPFRIHRL